MNRRRNQLSLALVAFVLGALIVVQLRSQEAGNGLDTLTTTELTVLVGNLNTHNDELRTEAATTQAELSQLQASDSRGDTSVGQLSLDLARLRAWAGLDPVDGPGVRITISGGIDGISVEDLINELRNSGAEAIAIGDVRVEPNSIVEGPAGNLLVEHPPGRPVPDQRDRESVRPDRQPDPSRRDHRSAWRDRSDGPADRHAGRHAAFAGHHPDARTGAWHAAALIPSRPDVTPRFPVPAPTRSGGPWLTRVHC